jgi:hypothetical protein
VEDQVGIDRDQAGRDDPDAVVEEPPPRLEDEDHRPHPQQEVEGRDGHGIVRAEGEQLHDREDEAQGRGVADGVVGGGLALLRAVHQSVAVAVRDGAAVDGIEERIVEAAGGTGRVDRPPQSQPEGDEQDRDQPAPLAAGERSHVGAAAVCQGHAVAQPGP